jgi:hypothetical protein
MYKRVQGLICSGKGCKGWYAKMIGTLCWVMFMLISSSF